MKEILGRFQWRHIKLILITYALLVGLLVLFQRFILLHPEKLSKDYFIDLPQSTEYDLIVDSKIKINGLRFATRDSVSKGVVLCFHGNYGNVLEYANLAEQFTNLGYDCVLYDYRGYGKTPGRLDEKNFLSDANHVFNNLTRRYDPDQIILYGTGFGCGAAIKVASKNKVKMLILESPYTDIPKLYTNILPIFPFEKASEFIVPAIDWFDKIRCRVEIFHGKYNRFIPLSHSQELLDKAHHPSKNKLTIIDGRNRFDVEQSDIYKQRIQEILK